MLGVEKLVPAIVSHSRPRSCLIFDSPLDSPLHGAVCNDQRWDEEEDLVPRAAQDVPETLGEEVGHGSLSVGAQGVGDDILAGTAAALIWVAPATNVPSV